MKTLLLLLVAFSVAPAFSNQEKSSFWVTLNNQNLVQAITKQDYSKLNEDLSSFLIWAKVQSISKAVPDARSRELQHVFEIEFAQESELVLNRMKRFSNLFIAPELAPQYELLYKPNDIDLVMTNDYALNLINAEKAWNISKGSEDVVIGISDQNYYIDHEDLVGKFDYVDMSNSAPRHHGTAVAITAAGNTDNDQGKSAIGFNCRLRLYKMSYNELIRASQDGVHVLNVSWASNCYFSYYGQIIINEVYNNGTIIVAAAGNGGTCGGPDHLVYPAAYDHVIAVSGVGPFDNHERFIGNPNTTFQHNSSVDVVAPGYDMLLSLAPGNYTTGNGTSFSAPLVSGLVGLMLSVDPCLTFENVEEILKTSAVDIYDLNPAYVGKLGAGRIDAFAALVETRKYHACHGKPKSIEEIGTIDFYPNPNSGQVTITSFEDGQSVAIYAMNGQKLIESNERRFEHDLPSGIYLMHLYNENKDVVGISKLFIQ